MTLLEQFSINYIHALLVVIDVASYMLIYLILNPTSRIKSIYLRVGIQTQTNDRNVIRERNITASLGEVHENTPTNKGERK